MTTAELQQFVEQDEDLDDLLNKQKVYMNTKFSDARYDNEALKTHIAADYYESFKLIYSNITGKKKSIVIPILKSVDFLATAELRTQIIEEHLVPTLESSTAALADLKANINNKNLEPYFLPIDEALSSPVFQIINQFGEEEKIKPYKDKLISISLSICDVVTKASPSKETMKYAVYNVIINNIKKVKNFGAFQEQFDSHSKKISAKRDNIDNKYVLWVIVVVIIFIIRLIARLT